MAARSHAPLRNITRETLEPLWARREIPIARMASALGVTAAGLSWKAKSLGLPSRAGNQRPRQKVDSDLFRRMWLAGVSSVEMAAAFGYSHPSGVTTRRRLMGLPPRTRGKSGKNNGGWCAHITIDQFYEAEVARAMHAAAGRAAA